MRLEDSEQDHRKASVKDGNREEIHQVRFDQEFGFSTLQSDVIAVTKATQNVSQESERDSLLSAKIRNQSRSNDFYRPNTNRNSNRDKNRSENKRKNPFSHDVSAFKKASKSVYV